MKGEALLVPRVQKVLPGLDLQEARKVSGQLLNLADGVWRRSQLHRPRRGREHDPSCPE